MLKFNSWPPAKGEVTFSPDFRERYRPEMAHTLGFAVGNLLKNNLPEEQHTEIPEIIRSIIFNGPSPDDIYDFYYDAEDGYDVHPFEKGALDGAGISIGDAAQMRQQSSGHRNISA